MVNTTRCYRKSLSVQLSVTWKNSPIFEGSDALGSDLKLISTTEDLEIISYYTGH